MSDNYVYRLDSCYIYEKYDSGHTKGAILEEKNQKKMKKFEKLDTYTEKSMQKVNYNLCFFIILA